MKKILTLITLFLAYNSFAGDILTLNNKMIFDGKITKIKDCAVVFKAQDNKYIIPASQIFSIQFENVDNKIYSNYLKILENDPNACFKGNQDAEQFHGKHGAHFLLGVLFGPFAIIGTALSNPTPLSGKQTLILSKNKDQFSDPTYLSCYKKKAIANLITWELLGWTVWLLFAL